MEKDLQTAIVIRKFNRFYLPYFHLLTQKYLNTEYSAAEARILYEIYGNKEISARDIVCNLHIDKSYLSRILKKFGAKCLIQREASQADSRMALISLTPSGEALVEKLIMETNQQIQEEIMGISDENLDELSAHLEKILEILGGGKDENY